MRDEGLVEVEDASARFVGRGHARARARWCSARWRARARCWWRCRRWWRRASWCRRAGWPTASTATAWRSCWPCWPATAASSLGGSDVFVSVAGGVRVDEPGADLAIALALASAAKGVALAGAQPLAAFGELGLTGELRHAAHAGPPPGRGDASSASTDVIRPGDGAARPCRHGARGGRAERRERRRRMSLVPLQKAEKQRRLRPFPVEWRSCRMPGTTLQSSRPGRNQGSSGLWRWSPLAPRCGRASTTSSRAGPAP